MSTSERVNVRIHGLVQGVFFRDTVRRIAHQYAVHGFVRNVGSDVLEIDVEGEPTTVHAFIDHVVKNPPPHARVDRVESSPMPPKGTRGFSIARSL